MTTLPTDAFVSQAFTELLADVSNLLESARGSDAAFWRTQHRALTDARRYYDAGARPVRDGDTYRLPSEARPDLPVYRLVRVRGIARCDCIAGRRGLLCKHHTLINVIERAAELEALAEDAKADRLARTISATRAKYMATA